MLLLTIERKNSLLSSSTHPLLMEESIKIATFWGLLLLALALQKELSVSLKSMELRLSPMEPLGKEMIKFVLNSQLLPSIQVSSASSLGDYLNSIRDSREDST